MNPKNRNPTPTPPTAYQNNSIADKEYMFNELSKKFNGTLSDWYEVFDEIYHVIVTVTEEITLIIEARISNNKIIYNVICRGEITLWNFQI